jgi:hypothetical protein
LKIVEVAITSFEVQKLVGYNTLEGGAHVRVSWFGFVDSRNKQVNVVHRRIQLFETLDELLNKNQNIFIKLLIFKYLVNM